MSDISTIASLAYGRPFEVGPKYIPADLTAEVSATCWVDLITISNEDSSAYTVTIQDTTLAFFKTVSIAANSTEVVKLDGGRKFTGSFKWQASSASKLVGYAKGLKLTGG